MGVYVKGMDMPTSCKSCEFRTGDSWGNWCEVTKNEIADEIIRDEKRNIDCPLIPAPPHGDLIDRDALKEQLEYVASLEWNQRVGASSGIECAIDMLDDARTIIPAEPCKEKGE